MVRARARTRDAILTALAVGDFYASTGVVLGELRSTPWEVRLRIDDGERPGHYRTQFIGREGRVLAEVAGTEPGYSTQSTDGYVRARVMGPDGACAWTQPTSVRPARADAARSA